MAAKGKTAAKPAPVENAIAIGSFVTFNGYDDAVPETERMLAKGESYEVVELTEAGCVVKFPNPDFNAKKKVHEETNPATLETEVFETEVTLAETPADAPPAKTATVTKIKSGQAPKAPKAVAEKPAKAPKAAKPAKAPKPPKVVVDKDALPELTEDQEDADVLALVNESTDLVATAQDLEGDIGRSEYQIGGVLYHIKKSKSYQELDAAYKEKGGFAAFTKDYLNIDYRKAMTLIDIYVIFSQLGIENPADRVAAIGWSKAAKITGPLQEEGAVAEDLLQLAQENSSLDLSVALKEQTAHVGGTKGEAVKKLTVKFRYVEEEATNITNLLTRVQEAQGLASQEAALLFIIDEFQTSLAEEVPAAAAPSQKAPVGAAKPKTAAKPVAKAKQAA